MGQIRHPRTGEDVRTEVVCEKNPPSYDHEFERVSESWGEIIDRCTHCGYEIVANVA